MTEITEIENEIFELIKKGSPKKCAKLLFNLLTRTDSGQLDDLVDLFGRVLKTKEGPKIYRYFSVLERKIDFFQKLYEMELAFIPKHILIEGEQLLDSFYGILKNNNETINGRIFLTNFRIIATGFLQEVVLPSSIDKINTGLIKLAINTTKDLKDAKTQIKIRKSIRKSRNYGFYSINHIQYGHYFPLSRQNTVMRKDNTLEYTTWISYILDDEKDSASLNIQIIREKPDNELQEDFKAKLMKTHKLFENTFKEASKSQSKLSIVKMGKLSDIGTYLGEFFERNKGKAWTSKAILNRIDELNIPDDLRSKVTEKMIADALEKLFEGAFLGRDVNEGNFFYFS